MAFVIFTDAEGVYIGHCMGLGFWSKLDSVDQPCATTFPTIQDAAEHMAGWEGGPPPGVSFVPVVPDEPGGFASIAACVRAGLPEWLIPDSETANCRPI